MRGDVLGRLRGGTAWQLDKERQKAEDALDEAKKMKALNDLYQDVSTRWANPRELHVILSPPINAGVRSSESPPLPCFKYPD
ncbi:uncharacterized protein EI90DRAFT_3082153, partial [Cantharellus anzutake]|uniref:uncharacterized protein n=1 Tax=Cantharellus anzutake TaxID=1750568 RepID=UPI0019087190